MGGLQFQLQMNWQLNLLSQRRKAAGPLGLKNLGNSCYLNSVLQCLTYTPPLANFCLRSQHSCLCDSVANGVKKRECPFCILERRIARSLSSDVALDTPSKIQSCLRLYADHFRIGFQEDAHEFLRYVIDACHNSCLRLGKPTKKTGDKEVGSTVVKKIFGGALQSQVKCLSCNSDSNKVDEIMDISLDVMYSNSVKEAMHKFFQPEVLDGNNKYKCEKCKKLVAARKQMSILEAPNVLVIQLKRFEGLLGKIDKSIAFQEVLLLSNFMSKSSKDPQPEYRLFGTIVHSGCSPESGHYYAYIKDGMGRWYCCNDSYVSLATLNEVLSEKVYILFFSRTNQSSNSFVSNGVKKSSTEENGTVNSKSGSEMALVRTSENEKCLTTEAPAASKGIKVSSGQRIKFNIHRTSTPGATSSDLEKTKCVAFDGQKQHDFPHSNGHNNEKFDVEPGLVQNEDIKDKFPNSMRANDLHVEPRLPLARNGDAKDLQPNGGVKRKAIDRPGNSASEDAQPRDKVEELWKHLEAEVFSFLRSCSWYHDVYDSMSSRKRLCVEESKDNPSKSHLKKLLVGEAKSKFISQVPESLKQRLIERLRSVFFEGR